MKKFESKEMGKKKTGKGNSKKKRMTILKSYSEFSLIMLDRIMYTCHKSLCIIINNAAEYKEKCIEIPVKFN